ncbi:MAG: RING finger protein [Acutalibacteraceae bacterium]
MDFTKYKCAVCNKNFNEGDDVVVCPECGTPHHRECFNQVGECINKYKHNSEEPVEILKADSESDKPNTENVILNEDFHRNENPENENLTEEQKEIQKFIEQLQKTGVNDDTELYDGCTVSEYEAVIGKNSRRFIPEFMLEAKAKKRISWNIPAFFVPLAWSVYRKMYGFAAIILAIYLALFGIISYPILSNTELMEQSKICYEEDPEFMYGIYNYLTAKEGSLTAEQTKFVDLMEDSALPKALSLTISLAEYSLRMVYALFANSLYFKKCTGIIKKSKQAGIPKENLNKFLFGKYATKSIVVAAIIGFFEIMTFIYI